MEECGGFLVSGLSAVQKSGATRRKGVRVKPRKATESTNTESQLVCPWLPVSFPNPIKLPPSPIDQSLYHL